MDLASSGRRRIDEEMNSNIAVAAAAVVEELAFLVKDNLPCKHLILSVEDVLVNFLQDDTSLDGVLELEPMNPYNRLLVHRLADIFGPPILVSDFFLELDEVQSPINFEEIRRKEVMPGQRNNVASKSSFEERETSYFAARKRIFSVDASETKLVKERPKNDPVVARRMITHALGQSNKVTENELSLSDTKECARAAKDLKIQYLDERDISSSNELGTAKHPRPCTTTEVPESSGFTSTNSTSKGPHQPRNDATQTKGKDINTQENYLRKEHMGAAKRLFANALGMHRRDVNIPKCDETKKTSC
ncbi:hypothetical protein DH2020_021819 [Rehmannia glutinosa]|uniref:R3H domain-containing protein n=1 Tax=Rehmannia glutinosa TaxID=99300 RepID=A0ABR0WD56_REHGL